ncbi:MAG TPA: FTR1 family protein [Candidatus Limnocylindria bacterium]|nr:FTR1 family protein [Candidatus Limnocylindria bacterium]
MDLGYFTTGLLTGLREGVEAALIVAIILAYLVRTGNARHAGRIWVGTGAAVMASAAVGVVLFVTIGQLESPAEQIFEGLAMLLAAGVVTWMLFWMRRVSANIRGELHAGVDRALTEGSVWGLSALAFTAVVREGIETSLFLLGQASAATSAQSGALGTLLGGVAGLLIAAVIGWGIYRGVRVLNLAAFFRWTGIALIFIAGGLISHAVHEFVEIGWVTIGTATAFDLSGVLPHEGEGLGAVIGSLLRALLGYTSTPEWATLIAWLAYIGVVLTMYLRPAKPVAPEPVQQPTVVDA